MARRKDKAQETPPTGATPGAPQAAPLSPAPAPSNAPGAPGVPESTALPTPTAPTAPTHSTPAAPAGAPVPARATPPRILCVERSQRALRPLREAVQAIGAPFTSVASLAEARAALAGGAFDAAVIDESQVDGSALDLVREFSADPNCICRFIVTSSREDLDAAVDAMRSGASDFINKPFTTEAITTRLRAAIDQARRLRENARKVERLKRICKRLNNARQEVSDHVDTLCTDLATAYQDLADQMSTATLATEFNALVRQELDVESLLRTTLEFMLTRTGPTNAAVFLPTGHQDYNLGAYVNYDIPRDTADVLLDHLADVIPQRFEDLKDMLHLDTERAQRQRLGEEASWLNDSTLVIFSCLDQEECLAVVALFRDRAHPFTDELLAQLEVMRDIFAEQLARVVRIHHRAVADPEWPGFDVEDDRGMAA